jgi:hypothetical protein
MKNDFDLDGDGKITEDELIKKEKMLDIQNKDGKSDSQEKMAWVSLLSMIGYAILPVLPFIDESRLVIVSSMSGTLFLALASIVGFFFGAKAYMNNKNK